MAVVQQGLAEKQRGVQTGPKTKRSKNQKGSDEL
jgi:hypothetical protein